MKNQDPIADDPNAVELERALDIIRTLRVGEAEGAPEDLVRVARHVRRDRPVSMRSGYNAFWFGEPYEVPAAFMRSDGARLLWKRGYEEAFAGACEARALPLRASRVCEGMACDSGRLVVSSVAVAEDVYINVKYQTSGQHHTEYRFRPNKVFWVNTAPAGTMALLARPLGPNDMLDAWTGLENIREVTLANPVTLETPVYHDKIDLDARDQAANAVERNPDPVTEPAPSAMAQAPSAPAAPTDDTSYDEWHVAESTRGATLGDALNQYFKRHAAGGQMTMDTFATAAGTTPEMVNLWMRGKAPPSRCSDVSLARALRLSVAKVRALRRHQWLCANQTHHVYWETSTELWAQLYRLMRRNDWDIAALSEATGIMDNALVAVICKRQRVRVETIDRLRNTLGIIMPPYGEQRKPSQEPIELARKKYTARKAKKVRPAGVVHPLTPAAAAPAVRAADATARFSPQVADPMGMVASLVASGILESLKITKDVVTAHSCIYDHHSEHQNRDVGVAMVERLDRVLAEVRAKIAGAQARARAEAREALAKADAFDRIVDGSVAG